MKPIAQWTPAEHQAYFRGAFVRTESVPGCSAQGVEVRDMPRVLAAVDFSPTWGQDEAGNFTVPVVSNTATAGGRLDLAIPGWDGSGMPFGTTTDVQLYAAGIIVCGAGHSAAPATMPKLQLWKISPGQANPAATDSRWPAPTLVYDVTDPSDAAALDKPHTLIVSAAPADPPLSMRAGDRYFLRVIGESGANAVVNGYQIGGVLARYKVVPGTEPTPADVAPA